MRTSREQGTSRRPQIFTIPAANANHLVLPPVVFTKKMKRTEKQFGIVLPLDYNGKINCATCHNPHQKGVIPLARFGAGGAGENYKKRFLGNICMACHEK